MTKNEKLKLETTITALISFLVLCGAENVKIVKNITIDWIGSKGIIAAMLIGILIPIFFEKIVNLRIGNKVFKDLPSNVGIAFESLIPMFCCFIVIGVVQFVFQFIIKRTFVETIYTLLQLPLQNLSDTFFGVISISTLISVFWFFGIHGNSIIGGVITPILLTNTIENQSIIAAHHNLTIVNGAHIVTQQFLNQFITMTYPGVTMGKNCVAISHD